MRCEFAGFSFVVAIAMVAGINVLDAQKSAGLSGVALADVEALVSDGSGGSQGYGCGYAAYGLDDDRYEDTKKVTKCVQGNQSRIV